MSFIDDRGRIFGRLNVVDAGLVLLAVAMVPVAYGAYLLFRDPTPRLLDVRPRVLNQGPNLQVEIHGENLRPYMRASFGTLQGRTFLFGNPTSAVVQLPDLPPGKYDVVLYDYMQEVSRLPGALTIEGPPVSPQITVEVTGAFTGVTADQVGKLVKGYRLPETGGGATILDVDRSEPAVARVRAGDSSFVIPLKGQNELPARLSVPCFLNMSSDGFLQCHVAGVPLAPDANFRVPGLQTSLNFRVAQVHYPGDSDRALLRVRFIVGAEVRPHVKPGDRDHGGRAFPTGTMATLVSVSDGPSVNALPEGLGAAARLALRPTAIDATVRVQADRTPIGWTYKGRPLKVGAPLTFETLRYTMDGLITSVDFEPDAETAATAPAPPGR